MKHIYEQLKEAGVEIDHHESDLYCPVNDVSTAIIENWKKERRLSACVSRFINRNDGKAWYDLAFAYLPFWEKKGKGAVK